MEYRCSLFELLKSISLDTKTDVIGDTQINNIAIDSRKVSDGSLFCAYPGEHSDGRDFIPQAQQAGAVAILYEAEGVIFPEDLEVPAIAVAGLRNKVGLLAHHFFARPSNELQVFGVTGTNGKTTCCYLLTQALTKLDMQAAMIGTVGAGKIGEMHYGGLTTPDPIEIHRLLANWRDQGITQVSMEVSSHALDQNRVAGVEFFCTMFTNLSHDHLDYHGDMAQYAAAKSRLFTDYHSELAIINTDDNYGAGIVDLANADFVASYGAEGDVSVDEAELTSDGMSLYIDAKGVEFEVQTPLIGSVNIPNILLLVATLLSLSVEVADIQAIVSELTPPPGRMELYFVPSQPRVVVDFAHTPDALEKALSSVRDHCAGQLWCVFGCGGDRDRAKRAVMGAAANRYADQIIVTNDNPRSESPESIARDILKGIDGDNSVILDRATAIRTAIEQAQSGDWVLVAGRGHETLQQIGDQYFPFSDREHVAQILGVAA